MKSEPHDAYGQNLVSRNLGAEAINLALLAAAATGVQVGAAIVASRFAVAEVPPLTLAMLRYAIGFACLAPFAWKALAVKGISRRCEGPVSPWRHSASGSSAS